MRSRLLAEIAGWTGILLILFSYIASVNNIISVHSTSYLLANGFGSPGIVLNSSHKKDIQPVVLNLVWLAVALIGLIRYR